ncbi:MAG TPA: GTPase, partial [Bacillota bacterium]|nr:GTPase [Bacillota bacterium]
SVLQSRKQLTCQRCYRIQHYGDAGTTQPGKAQIEKNIAKAIQLSQLLVIVVDFSDLTGTLPIWADYLADKPYLLVINKCDLLPSQTKYEEVKGYLDQYLKKLKMATPQRILLVSALEGNGTTVLGEQIKRVTASGAKVAFLGVTNVGKSSLIKQFLKAEGSEHTPTVSKIPGTTMGLSNWSIFKGRNTLIDTPGLVPGNRAGDLLCPECGSRLVATTKIAKKLWGIKPGKGLIVGGLLAVEPLGETENVLIAFTSAETATHRTDCAKISEILKTNPAWLEGVCGKCIARITWQEHTVTLETGSDLAVAGLGWVSSRGVTTRFRVTLPEGVYWEVRPGLIGKKPER